MDTTYASSNPGTLDRKVVIMHPVFFLDETGSPKKMYHPLREVDASIQPISGKAFWEAQQSNSEASVRVLIRYVKNISPETRLMYQAPGKKVYYDLVGLPIDIDLKHEYLELVCKETNT